MSDYKEVKYSFRPVKCTEEKIRAKKIAPINGYIYFATDTQKLFLGENNEFVEMCTSKDFYYGQKVIEYDNSGVKPSPNVLFFKNEIEGSRTPEVDDLILNVDGCFYRVRSVVNNEEIHTERLTLQGTGTGGGGGGNTPGTPSYSLSLPSTSLSFGVKTKSMLVGFRVVSDSDETDNYVNKVEFRFNQQTVPFCTINGVFNFSLNTIHYVNLIDYKDLFPITASKINIKTYDMRGKERDTYFTIEMIDLYLEKSQKDLVYSVSPNYIYICELFGGNSNNVKTKKLVYDFYTEENLKTPIHTHSKTINKNSESNVQENLDLSKLKGHGSYILKVHAEATLVNGETIPSNELVSKIAYFDKVNNNSPILMVSTPETTEQYTSIPLQYLLVYPDGEDAYTLEIRLNNKVEKELVINTNNLNSYDLYFERAGSYLLTCVVKELDVRYETDLVIKEYTGNIPVIDTNNANLLLCLSPRGKTNQELNKNTWSDINGNYTATLNGLHYGTVDGWLTDPDTKINYLKMISGATLSLKDFKPFKNDPTVENANIDTRLGYGMTIELDFEINGTLDYDTEVIKCISYNQNKIVQVGFGITGNKIRFYNDRLNGQDGKGPLLSANLVEGKRVRVSFVIESKKQHKDYPMAYIYLDGILSGAVIYDPEDKFIDDDYQPATLEINATDAQVKLYGIRFYSTALSHRAILNNYTASLSTNEEREYSYNSNNVFDSSNKIDYLKVANANYQLDIPYMTITGGWKTEEDSKWQLLNSVDADVDNNPGLPTGKKDYRLIDVEVHYPQNDLFKGYKDYSFTNEFKNGMTMAEAFKEKPTNGGAIMYAQGTSSMEYPIKNLRLRFKKEDDWYSVRPDIQDVEIICMKADYMESSGSHNTGAANFIDSVYSSSNLKTPGQRHFGSDSNTIVTCIKGYPCLIFYRPDKDTPYEYIGKYNLNLDKATPQPFGFDHDNSDFGYLPVGEKYYKVTYYDKDDPESIPFIGQAKPTEGGDYYPDQTETEATVQEGEKINSIHCFEFLDNAVEVCNFMNKAKSYIKDDDGNLIPDPTGGYYTYEETWYNTFKNVDSDDVPGWTLGFESRYPEDRVGYHDADMLYPLASWINELQALRETDEKQALARFKNEYQCYLNRDFLLIYYLITEALLMADSRVKNMMIATWGKKASSYTPLKFENNEWVKDTSKAPIETNFYEFYPIFYDMDTMLGLDNTGVYRFNYYDEDTDEAVYNGRDILWNFVRDSLGDQLPSYYSSLENSLHESVILNYFNKNQANMANQAFYNGDADYKYLSPARNGYEDHLNDKFISAGTAPYLYAAQGDRSLMREWFLNNRMKFLRGKYTSSKYRSGDRVEFRWYYPKENDNNPRLAQSAKVVPPDGEFEFTSLQTGYAGVTLGANSDGVNNVRFNGEEKKKLNVTSAANANGTEAYLLGLSNLADLGDLSNKYMQKFILGSSDIRLKRLILGNPHKDYYNPYWGTSVEGVSGKIALTNCFYLREFNLQNCDTYTNTLDFSDSSAIETILLTGSGVSGVTLPSNGILKELRLPTTVNKIVIHTHPYLTEFSIGSYDYESANSDIINNKQYYTNDYSGIRTIDIVDTPIDTYVMATNAENLAEYNLQGINWTITKNDIQYCSVTDTQADFTSGKTYYSYNADTKTYEEYKATIYPDTGLLYEKYEMLDADNNITCIPVLNQLLTKRYLNGTSHGDSLSGTILIDIPNATVDEYTIYRMYASKYPNLSIKYGSSMGEVTKAYSIDFYQQENVTDSLLPYYSVLHDGSSTLDYLISENGPNGKALTTPVKSQDNEYKYEFTGVWTVISADAGSGFSVGQNVAQADFATLGKPKGNIAFAANYNRLKREYNITLYQDDRETVLLQTTLYWNDDIGAKLKDSKPELTYNYKPYTDINFPHNRYTFKGWQSSDDNTNKVPNPTWANLNGIHITGDFTAYAYYEVEDARYNESNEIYFTASTVHINNINGNSYNGLAISINPLYRNVIQGHLTIPSKYQNQDIYFVKDFKNMTKITDVYFLDDNQYKGIFDGSFEMDVENKNNALKNVYLPKTDNFKFIWGRSFYNCHNLEHIALDGTDKLSDSIEHIGSYAFGTADKLGVKSSLYLNELPSNLVVLDSGAFVRSGDNVIITELPPHLKVLSEWSLSRCAGVNISVFGSENAGEGLTTIDAGALYDSGPKVTAIELKQSITTLASQINSSDYAAFENYAPNLSTFTSAKPASEIKDLNGNTLTTFADAGVPAVTIVEALQEV